MTKAPLRTRIAMIGNGGVFSTANDMLKFLGASTGLVQTPLENAFKQLAKSQKPIDDAGRAIGLGWQIRSRNGTDVIWHNGGTAGFRTYTAFLRGETAGVVVLSNVSTFAGVDDLGAHLLGHGELLPPDAPGVAPSRPRTQVAVDAQLLDAYVGDYRHGDSILIAMRRRGDQLWVRIGDKATLPLFAESETVFFMGVMDMTFRFEVDENGEALSVILGKDGKEARFPRLEAPGAP